MAVGLLSEVLGVDVPSFEEARNGRAWPPVDHEPMRASIVAQLELLGAREQLKLEDGASLIELEAVD